MKQPYAKSVDMWAIGFIQYELLTNEHPIIGSERYDR